MTTPPTSDSQRPVEHPPATYNPATGGVTPNREASNGSRGRGSVGFKSRRMAAGTAIGIVAVLISAARLLWIEADFPAGLNWSGDLYTDEGGYASAAVLFVTAGHWLVPGDFNPIVNMPMAQLVHALVFELAGPSLASARYTSVAWSLWLILGTYLLVRRYAGSLQGAVAALLLSANFTYFAFSRIALNEVPTMGWVMLAILVLTTGPSRASTVLSAILFSAAILTKPTALFALPALLYVVLHRSRNGKAAALDTAAFLAAVAALAGGYHLWARANFPADYAYFDSLLIDARVTLGLGPMIWNLLRTIWHSLVLGPFLCPLAVASAVGLLGLSPNARRNPALWIAMLWLAGASLVLVASSYHPPRYFLLLSVPAVVLVAMGTVELLLRFPRSKLGLLVSSLVAVSLALDIAQAVRYLASPKYSLLEMAEEVGDRIREDGLEDPVLLGNMADTIGLVTGLRSVDDRLGWMDLAERLELHSPDYYISLGVYEGLNETISDFGQLELLAVYDVLGNYYSGKRVYFYRINPREATECDGAAMDAATGAERPRRTDRQPPIAGESSALERASGCLGWGREDACGATPQGVGRERLRPQDARLMC